MLTVRLFVWFLKEVATSKRVVFLEESSFSPDLHSSEASDEYRGLFLSGKTNELPGITF